MFGRRIRRLTPTECGRLQTIPKWYKWNVSETQQYRMLGNGWTIEVIKHIFSFMPLKLSRRGIKPHREHENSPDGLTDAHLN